MLANCNCCVAQPLSFGTSHTSYSEDHHRWGLVCAALCAGSTLQLQPLTNTGPTGQWVLASSASVAARQYLIASADQLTAWSWSLKAKAVCKPCQCLRQRLSSTASGNQTTAHHLKLPQATSQACRRGTLPPSCSAYVRHACFRQPLRTQRRQHTLQPKVLTPGWCHAHRSDHPQNLSAGCQARSAARGPHITNTSTYCPAGRRCCEGAWAMIGCLSRPHVQRALAASMPR